MDKPIHDVLIIVTEIMIIREALRIRIQLQLANIIVEDNYLIAINFITSKMKASSLTSQLLTELLFLQK